MNEERDPAAFELDDVELVSATHPLAAVVPRPNTGRLWSTEDELRFDVVLASKRTRVLSCPLSEVREVKVGEWERTGRRRGFGRRGESTASGGLQILTASGEIQFRVSLEADDLRDRATALVGLVRARRSRGDGES